MPFRGGANPQILPARFARRVGGVKKWSPIFWLTYGMGPWAELKEMELGYFDLEMELSHFFVSTYLEI